MSHSLAWAFAIWAGVFVVLMLRESYFRWQMLDHLKPGVDPWDTMGRRLGPTVLRISLPSPKLDPAFLTAEGLVYRSKAARARRLLLVCWMGGLAGIIIIGTTAQHAVR